MPQNQKNGQPQSIGFIGLGAMGVGMVDPLLRGGFEARGFDLRAETLDWLKERGGKPATSPADAHQVVMIAVGKGLGAIDDAGFVKVYEQFTGARIALSEDAD